MANTLSSLIALLMVFSYSILTEGKLTRESRQILIVPKLSASGSPFYHQSGLNSYFYPTAFSNKQTPSSEESTARFFGLSNLLSGLQPPCPTCPTCPLIPTCPAAPTCPVAPTCPALPAPETLPTISASDCTTVKAACLAASVAPSGNFIIEYAEDIPAGDTVSTSVVSIVAQAPNTKVKVICQNIPTGVVLSTQSSGTLAMDSEQTENKVVTLLASTDKMVDVAGGSRVVCSWKSTP